MRAQFPNNIACYTNVFAMISAVLLFEAALEESEKTKALIQQQTRLRDSDAAAQIFYNLGLCHSAA